MNSAQNPIEMKFYKTDRDFNPLEEEEISKGKRTKKSSVIDLKTAKPTPAYSKISVRSVSSLDHQAS
jgi:hypothetical protein